MNYEYRLYQYLDGVLTLQKRSGQWNDANTWDGWEDVDTVFEAQEEANERFRKREGIAERQTVAYPNGAEKEEGDVSQHAEQIS